jgi:hypothetical protein
MATLSNSQSVKEGISVRPITSVPEWAVAVEIGYSSTLYLSREEAELLVEGINSVLNPKAVTK